MKDSIQQEPYFVAVKEVVGLLVIRASLCLGVLKLGPAETLIAPALLRYVVWTKATAEPLLTGQLLDEQLDGLGHGIYAVVSTVAGVHQLVCGAQVCIPADTKGSGRS